MKNTEKKVMAAIHKIVQEKDYNTADEIVRQFCKPYKTIHDSYIKWGVPLFWREDSFFIATEIDGSFSDHELMKGMKNLLSFFGEGYSEYSDQFLEKIFEI